MTAQSVSVDRTSSDRPESAATLALTPVVASDSPTLVRLRNLSKRFGIVTAVHPLDLDIYRGDFFAILGPSGCGKTTLLRMIGGFEVPTTGNLQIDGVDVTRLPPERRPTNMVFQGYGLFPHMNVRQNIAYGLRLARVPKAELADRVNEAMALVRLEALAERPVQKLSGGQQQRVALARALVMRPKVLLLDEPLAALDLKLRKAMQEELRRIHHSIGGTFVFVTHDQGEALALANRIAVMEAGSLVQEGTAEEIYETPRSRFVSAFIGEANMLAGGRNGGTVTLGSGARFASAGRDGPVTTIVRPEAIAIAAVAPATDVRVTGTLIDVVYLGPYVKYVVALADGGQLAVHRPEAALRRILTPGSVVHVGWSLVDSRCFDDE